MNSTERHEATVIPFPGKKRGRKFRGAVLTCAECKSEFRVPPVRAAAARYCSKRCADANRSAMQDHRKKRVALTCAGCKEPFEAHACHAKRRRYCSEACRNAAWSNQKAGHRRQVRLGLRSGVTLHSSGHLREWAPDHPFASNGYVMQHRLVMERWLRENDPGSRFLITLGSQLYLSPGFEVHHQDEVKTNNQIANLWCLTPAEHTALHSKLRALRAAS